MIAAVRCRLIVLAPRFVPLDRPIQLSRTKHREKVGGVRRNLAAEATAHLRGDDADPVFRNSRHHRDQKTQDVRILRRIPQRELARRAAPFGERGSRFHRVRDQSLLHDPLIDDDVRVRKCRIHVAAVQRPVKREVIGNVGMQLRRARLHGLLGIDGARERFVLDVDELERVVGLIRRLGHHDRHDIANIAHDVLGDARIGRDLEVGIRQEPRARRRSQRIDVGAGVDRDNTRRGLRLARIDADDARMRVRAS